MTRALALLALGLVAVGCGADGPPSPSAFELGLQDGDTFVPLEDGAEVLLEPGGQGGFHIEVLGRGPEQLLDDVGPEPLLSARVRQLDNGLLASRIERRVRWVTTDDDGARMEQVLRLFMCPTPFGVTVVDEALSVEFQLRAEEDAAPATARVEIVARCPDLPFCREICAPL